MLNTYFSRSTVVAYVQLYEYVLISTSFLFGRKDAYFGLKKYPSIRLHLI